MEFIEYVFDASVSNVSNFQCDIKTGMIQKIHV